MTARWNAAGSGRQTFVDQYLETYHSCQLLNYRLMCACRG